MTVVHQRLTISIFQFKLESTELGTFTTVGRTAETILGSIAYPTVTDAESTMYEYLQSYIRHSLMNGTYLIYRQFTGQYHPAESQTMQPRHLVGTPVVRLSTGMCIHRCLLNHIQYPHILYEYSINTSIRQVVNQLASCIQFIIIDNRVDRHIHFSGKLMGITAEFLNISYGVTGSSPGAEVISTYIDSICTMINGSLATFQILGRSQQFQWSHLLFYLIYIVRCFLIYIIIYPVIVEQVGVSTP